MRVVYVDESDTPDKKSTCLVAVVASAEAWGSFERAWAPMLAAMGVPFHAKDRRFRTLFIPLRDLILQHADLVHVLSIDSADYHQHTPKWVQSHMGGPYRFLVFTTLVMLNQQSERHGWGRLTYAIEGGHKEFEHVAYLMDRIAESEGLRAQFSLEGWFRASKANLPVACADFVANQWARGITTGHAELLAAIVKSGKWLEGYASEDVIKMWSPRARDVVKQLRRDNERTRAELKKIKRGSEDS